MDPVSMALRGYFAYQGAKSIPARLKGLKRKYDQEKSLAKEQSDARIKDAEDLASQWDMYNTGSYENNRLTATKNSAGTLLKAGGNFSGAMMNNLALASIPRTIAGLTSGGVSLLKSTGIHNAALDTVGTHASNIASSTGALSNTMYNLAAYTSPSMYLANMARHSVNNALGSVVGGAGVASMISAPLMIPMMSLLNKYTNKAVSKLTGSKLSKADNLRVQPIKLSASLHKAAEFMDISTIDRVNQITNQIQALDPKHEQFKITELTSVDLLGQIAANTSSIPILTSEFINSFIKKNDSAKIRYNENTQKYSKYLKGRDAAESIEKHATRVEHGKFAHTITENIGLAANETASFLNKMSIGTDLIKQLQIVMSGGNIAEEMNKYDKSHSIREQKNASIFNKRLGIGNEESYVNMYYSITEDSQAILKRANSFEDAQIGLLSGIYEFTRMTAVEAATIRTRGYGIEEPVKYNQVAATDKGKTGVMEWLANKIPFFEITRKAISGATNLVKLSFDKFAKEGKFKDIVQNIIGKGDIKLYHDDRYNRLAEEFDLKRDTTLFERISEPFVQKLNESILKIPGLRLFGNENRMDLATRKKLEKQEDMVKTINPMMKEMGLEELSSQQLFYKYATTTMPDQFDLMVHHLSNVSLFTHATMMNTANLAKAYTGVGDVEQPNSRKMRTMNKFTGRMETDEENKVFMESIIKSIAQKAEEDARESSTIFSRGLDAVKHAIGKSDTSGNHKERLVNGAIEAFMHLFESEKLTAESSWNFSNKMAYRPLMSKEFLEELKGDKNYREHVLNKDVDMAKLQAAKHSYGETVFNAEVIPEYENQETRSASEIPEQSHILAVDIAKISNKEFHDFLNHSSFSKWISSQPVANKQPSMSSDIATGVSAKRTPAISKDNSIEGVKDALKSNKENIEEEQLTELEEINKHLKSLPIAATLLPAPSSEESGQDASNLKVKSSTTSMLSSTLAALGGALVGGGKNVWTAAKALGGGLLRGVGSAGNLLRAGATAASSLVSLPVAAVAATAAAGAYGFRKASLGRESEIIENLDKQHIITYNRLGDSEINDYKQVSRLPLEYISAMVSFDDWDKEDKEFLEKLLTAKTKYNSLKKHSADYYIKSQKQLESVLEEEEKKNERAQGTVGKWFGKGFLLAKRYLPTGLTSTAIGMVTKGLSFKDNQFLEQLEDSGIINYYTMPFMKSEIRNWDMISRLDTDHLKILSKLNFSDDDKKRLDELILDKLHKERKISDTMYKMVRDKRKAAEKQQYMKEHPHAKDLKDIKHSSYFSVSNKSLNKFIDHLDKAGVIEHNIFGKSELIKLDVIGKMTPGQLKALKRFDDWSDADIEYIDTLIAKKEHQHKNTVEATKVQKGLIRSMYNKVSSGIRHLVSNKTINDLEEKGVIEHNIFGNSKIKDWDAVEKLPTDEITKLVKLDDWDDVTMRRLKSLQRGTTLKQYTESVAKLSSNNESKVSQPQMSAMTTRPTFVNSIKNNMKNLTDQIMTKADNGQYTIDKWDKVKQMSLDQLDSLKKSNLSEDTLAKLESIYKHKAGQAIATDRDTQNIADEIPQSGVSKNDIIDSSNETLTSLMQNSVALLNATAQGISQLVDITASGMHEQIKATYKTASNLTDSFVQSQASEPGHPILDD